MESDFLNGNPILLLGFGCVRACVRVVAINLFRIYCICHDKLLSKYRNRFEAQEYRLLSSSSAKFT